MERTQYALFSTLPFCVLGDSRPYNGGHFDGASSGIGPLEPVVTPIVLPNRDIWLVQQYIPPLGTSFPSISAPLAGYPADGCTPRGGSSGEHSDGNFEGLEDSSSPATPVNDNMDTFGPHLSLEMFPASNTGASNMGRDAEQRRNAFMKPMKTLSASPASVTSDVSDTLIWDTPSSKSVDKAEGADVETMLYTAQVENAVNQGSHKAWMSPLSSVEDEGEEAEDRTGPVKLKTVAGRRKAIGRINGTPKSKRSYVCKDCSARFMSSGVRLRTVSARQ